MTIRKCPHCAQFTHLDEGTRTPLFCWSCAARVDFAALRSPGQILVANAATSIDRALPDPSRLVRAARIALVVAAPVAAAMLLICNGFDVHVVRDASAPFLTR